MSIYLGMEELVEVVGEAAALRLLAAHGGERIYVPRVLTEDHRLIRVMGETAALALVAHMATGMGGTDVDLPRGPSGQAAQQRARLPAAIEAGAPANEIARNLGVSRRTVFRGRRRAKAAGDPRQMKLL